MCAVYKSRCVCMGIVCACVHTYMYLRGCMYYMHMHRCVCMTTMCVLCTCMSVGGQYLYVYIYTVSMYGQCVYVHVAYRGNVCVVGQCMYVV